MYNIPFPLRSIFRINIAQQFHFGGSLVKFNNISESLCFFRLPFLPHPIWFCFSHFILISLILFHFFFVSYLFERKISFHAVSLKRLTNLSTQTHTHTLGTKERWRGSESVKRTEKKIQKKIHSLVNLFYAVAQHWINKYISKMDEYENWIRVYSFHRLNICTCTCVWHSHGIATYISLLLNTNAT